MGGSRYDLSVRLARLAAGGESPTPLGRRCIRHGVLGAGIAMWVVATTGATLGQQPQPETPAAPATASIAGRLIDAATPLPAV